MTSLFICSCLAQGWLQRHKSVSTSFLLMQGRSMAPLHHLSYAHLSHGDDLLLHGGDHTSLLYNLAVKTEGINDPTVPLSKLLSPWQLLTKRPV